MLNYVTYDNNKENWIVFIHGIGGSTNTWKKQIESFSESYNLLLIDLPGHGKSQNSELDVKITRKNVNLALKDVLDNVGIKKADFVVMSLGCLVIANFVTKYPEYVNAIVFGGSILEINCFYKALTGIIKVTKRFIPHRFLYKTFALIMMPRKNHKRSRKIFVRESLKMKRESFMQWVDYLSQITHPKKLLNKMKNLNIKILFVSGDEDTCFLKGAKKVSKLLEKSKIDIIKKCGHVCTIEKAKEFNQLALNFLQSVHKKPVIV